MGAKIIRDMPLSTRQCAELVGCTPSVWRVRVHRETAPPPDGHFDGRTPYWWQTTIDAYRASTNGVLVRPNGR